MEWLKLLLISSISLGVWVSFALMFNRTGQVLANRLLMALVLAMLLPPLNVYSQLAFGTIDWCWILATNLTWLYGPLLLGFLQAIRGRTLSVRAWGLHITPFALSLFWRLADLSLWLPGLASLLIAQVLAYLSFCLWLLLRHRHTFIQTLTRHKTSYYYWLLYLAMGLAVLMLVDVVLIVRMVWFEAVAPAVWQYLVALTALYIQGVAFCSLYRPNIFFNDCRDSIRTPAAQLASPREGVLDADTAQLLAQELLQLMHNRQPYLDNDLSLGKLARLLGISSHQLSWLLNDHLHESFYDFITRYRLDEALQLLQNTQSPPAIIDVAYAAGFNNKNSFYRTFKQRTGVTPAEYRRNVLLKQPA